MAKQRLIYTDDTGNEWFVISKGQGCYYSPPDEAHRKYHIAWKSNQQLKIPSDQHYSLSGVVNSNMSFVPEPVKIEAKKLLKEHPGNPKDEKWIKWIYDEIGGSYSPNGSYINLFINSIALKADNKSKLRPEWSLACMLIREFDPE